MLQKASKLAVVAALTASMLATLTGCSAGSNTAPTAKPYSFKPTSQNALVEFAKIATKSCNLANSKGTVQIGSDKYSLIMVPKDKALGGYSAAYKDESAKSGVSFGLIYENDAFYACLIANQIEMQAEAGSAVTTPAGQREFEKTTTVYADAQPNTYDVTSKFDGTTTHNQYVVKNGLIVSATNDGLSRKKVYTYTVSYGYTAKDLDILKNAVKTLN